MCHFKYIGRPYNDVYFYYTASPSERVGLVSILWQKAGRSIYNQSPKYSGSPSFYHLPLSTESIKDGACIDIGHNQMLKTCLGMTIDDGAILKEIKCQFDYQCKYTHIPKLFFSKTFAKSAIKLWKEIPPKMTQKMVQKWFKIDEN